MRHIRGVLLVAVVFALGACAAGGSPTGPTGPESSQPTTIESWYNGVSYYPACGNEVLNHAETGTTWYPFSTDESEAWEPPWPQGEPSAGGMGGGQARVQMPVPAVAAPGPGDDYGTLTIFEGGIAYWASSSGDLDTWLTMVPMTYNWVC